MKARLLYRNHDFDWKWALEAARTREFARTGRIYTRTQSFDPQQGIPWNADELVNDLSLDTLFKAMSGTDDCIYEVSRKIILTSMECDAATVKYRQEILLDCIENSSVIREIYAVVSDAVGNKEHYLGLLVRYPEYVLRYAIEATEAFLEPQRKLRAIADLHAHKFMSEGWLSFFNSIKTTLDDQYFIHARDYLTELKFRHGNLFSAKLGTANKGVQYLIHRVHHKNWSFLAWWNHFFKNDSTVYSFEINPRDEAGIRALGVLRGRGISVVANALGKSTDYMREFFGMLRMELAFYIGCLALHDRLKQKGEPICIPLLTSTEERQWSIQGLYDVALSVKIDQRVVGNSINADGKRLVIITGANTGGKSTFLRSVGLAQMMMQSGMFVPAESFCSSLHDSLFTHFKKEEDKSLGSGKFDEELKRMSDIVDHITSHSVIFFNESFSSTNEREGSEISRQITSALWERGIRIFFVTHMYDFSHDCYEKFSENAIFLRADREIDGTRSFKLVEGKPLPTSFGEDLYNRIFSDKNETSIESSHHHDR